MMYTGGQYQITFNNQEYLIQIPQLCSDHHVIDFNDDIQFILETVNEEGYQRDGDDLIQILQFHKKFVGYPYKPEFLTIEIEILEIIIIEGKFDIGEYGFKKSNGNRGHYHRNFNFNQSLP